MSTTWASRPLTKPQAARCYVLAAVAVSGLFVQVKAAAQQIYKYRDESGVWVYTDRPAPENRNAEVFARNESPESPTVRFFERPNGPQRTLVVANTYFCPVQIAYQITNPENLASQVPLRGNRILQARSETELFALEPEDASRPVHYEFTMQYLTGSPRARHEPERDYRVPFAAATVQRVSQAYPSEVTHTDAASRYAIDFAAPIGTKIYAAREGVVVEVASEFFESGLDPAVDISRANFVRVLHDDGTLALYAHLAWSSIRVMPGQRIERGQYIADSGNTGYSSGPHLHFVVQRNNSGEMVSVPVRFVGAGGSSVDVHTGDLVTAY